MKLGKAGDGLPPWERLLVRIIFIPLVRTFFTWEIARWLLQREVKIILGLIRYVVPNNLRRETLIDKIFAIEDHSRQFSINMVLEHLVITGSGVMEVIRTLSNEKAYTGSLTIQGVKPFENRADATDAFVAFYGQYMEFYSNLKKRQSCQTAPHPWFGQFNNFDWHIFMYMHTFIHRRQIEAILSVQKEKA